MPHEPISVFDMFKIGVGPSSSHTLGPWRAALRCLDTIRERASLQEVSAVTVLLYGSLAKTGKGHGTDIAVILGLCGEDPVTIEVNAISGKISYIQLSEQLLLELHNGDSWSETFYSIGGGFVVKEGEGGSRDKTVDLAFPINTADDLLHWCMKGLSISEVVMENELAWRSEAATRQGVWRLWETMRDCIYRGCHAQGELPGGLRVRRRAFNLNKKLVNHQAYNNYDEWIANIRKGGSSFAYTLDWRLPMARPV
ncbi:L-serine ammonia-lyase [Russula earlei]|uniref:L-serine ammonia-lyase n=1 Tax=Russula earlei TaxID=71964 RepID=A0ACC0TQT1_9AGAM|nr:L-serine ammonia-lyase [Russula earlei]